MQTHIFVGMHKKIIMQKKKMKNFYFLLFRQVLDERICHIERTYQSDEPEEYYQPSGKELQPRPVGEEGTVVFNYMPISAVHYVSEFP
jgi:hypothetical protein